MEPCPGTCITTGVCAAYDPYTVVSVDSETESIEYTLNRFDQVLGARVSGREQPPDGKIPRFAHIDKAVEHTVRQEAKEGDSVKVNVTVSADEAALPHDVKKYL